MVSNTPFQPGDRFKVRPLGDRYDNVEGTVRKIFADAHGERYAHTRHDDGALTMWPLSRLERIEPLLDAGVEPAPSNLDSWTCPVCSWTTQATGPATAGEPDGFQQGIDRHRDGHESPLLDMDPGWGEVPGVALWLSVADETPELLDAFAAMARKVGPTDLARVLRAAADVMDGAQ